MAPPKKAKKILDSRAFLAPKGGIELDRFFLIKTSPKFSASKCDVGNGIRIFRILEIFVDFLEFFEILWEVYRNSLEILSELFEIFLAILWQFY